MAMTRLLLATAAFILGATCVALNFEIDASMVPQAALRIQEGQRLYRDFYVPNGPVAIWLFMPFLTVMPTVGWAIIMATGVLNAIATLLAFQIVHEVADRKNSALLAGSLTGLWFTTVFGGYYHDHVAFAFVLLAAWLTIRTRFILVGVAFAAAFLCKQTVAVPAAMAWLVGRFWVRAKPNTFRETIMVSFGGVLGLTLVSSYFLVTGVFENFLQADIVFPVLSRHPSISRDWFQPLLGGVFSILVRTFFPFGIEPWAMFKQWGVGRLIFFPLSIFFYLALAHSFYRRHQSEKNFVLLFLALATVWGSAFLGRFYGHCFFGMAIVTILLSEVVSPFYSLKWFPSAVLFVVGVFYVLNSKEFRRTALPKAALGDLRPLTVRMNSYTLGSVRVVNFLKAHPGEFILTHNLGFVVPLALRRSPVQPCLDLFESTGIPTDPKLRISWESEMIRTLESRKVRFVVWGKDPYHLRDYQTGLWFPKWSLVDAYIKSNYDTVFMAGPIRVLERREKESKLAFGHF